jgi:hypothetical protein
VLVWVSYVYSLLTHRRSDVPAASISAAAASAAAAANSAPSTPTSSTPFSASHTPTPHSATTPSSLASPSPRKQLSFASSIALSHSLLHNASTFKSHDALPGPYSSIQSLSSPNKSSHLTGSRMRWDSDPVRHSLPEMSPHAPVSSSQPDLPSSVSRNLTSSSSAGSALRVALPAEMPSQAQDTSTWCLRSDASSSTTSSVASSPLHKSTAGSSWLITRDSVELASRRMHATPPSEHALPSPLSSSDPVSLQDHDPVSLQDHLLGVYSPRHPSRAPAPLAPIVSSPLDGPLARALSHASPFKSNTTLSGGSSSPASGAGAATAGAAPSGTEGGAVIAARMKLQDSLALSLNSPVRDKQHQQRATSAPSSSGFMRGFAAGIERQGQETTFQLEQEHEEEAAWREGGQYEPDDSRDDAVDEYGAGDEGRGREQEWRLSTGSQTWTESADAERPFTQSLGGHRYADSGGSRGYGSEVLESSGRSARSEGLGSRVQVVRVLRFSALLSAQYYYN